MKRCCACKENLPHDRFYRTKASKDGLQGKCKDCARQYTRNWQIKNADKYKAMLIDWRSNHQNYHKDWYNNNAEYARERGRGYYQENKEAFLVRRSLRQSRVKFATPPMSDKHKAEMAEIYRKAKQLSRDTGVQYHVDHIFPLVGKNCCGLHVPWNLKIITAQENLRKHNKVPDNFSAAQIFS
jgi:5-methylcytosine-specific restriction endonuclease McrA